MLESRACRLDGADRLRRDLIFLDSTAIRIIYEMFARDNYHHTSKTGTDALMVFLWSLPDNKIVEDIHQPIRLAGRGSVNRKMSFRNIQSHILESAVLEKRGIKNGPKVDRETWLAKSKRTKLKSTTQTHQSHKHKLPKAWSRMMAPRKTWATISEETLQRSAAASHWLHFCILERGASLPADVKIEDAMCRSLCHLWF